MGGSVSKSTYQRDIDVKLNSTFQANCAASAVSIQTINLKNVNIITRDNCSSSFTNRASLNTSCDMSAIIDSIAEMAASTDEEFAKTLQDVSDREAFDKCEADNCLEKLKINVKKNLSASCATEARAMQTFNMDGGTIYCDGNSVAQYGNFAEVRASCLRSMLLDGAKAQSSVTESKAGSVAAGSGGGDTDNGGGELDHNTKLMIGVGVALVAFVVVKKNQESNE